jgi:hypothetical protein
MPPSTNITLQPFLFGKVTAAVGVASLPLTGLTTFAALPNSNTRQIVVLNTGINPLLFGVLYLASTSDWPSTFGGTGPAVVPIEGGNCTRVPAGGSLTIDIGSLQDRGNMGVPGFNTAAPVVPLSGEFPFSLIFFSSLTGPTTGDITYVNRLGVF